jgi:hypothetical protein
MKKTLYIISSVLFGIAITLAINKDEAAQVDKNSFVTLETNQEPKSSLLYHLNNNYVFDLSNRILSDNKKRVSDLDLMKYFVNQIDGKFRKAFNRRSVIQKDVHRIQTTSPLLYDQFNVDLDNLTCDLSKFKRPSDLSNYLFDRNSNGKSMKSWKNQCFNEFNSMYNNAKVENRGSDIFTYIKDCKRYFGKKLPKVKIGKTIRENRYKENLFLVTDGYIEYGKYPQNKIAPYLSKNRIESFKDDFKKEGNNRSLQDFFKEEGYGITPIFDTLHSNINVLVIGFEDRSVDSFGLAKRGVEIKDREVLEIFWNDWLNKSGFNKVKIAPTLSSIDELDELVFDFIEK